MTFTGEQVKDGPGWAWRWEAGPGLWGDDWQNSTWGPLRWRLKDSTDDVLVISERTACPPEDHRV